MSALNPGDAKPDAEQLRPLCDRWVRVVTARRNVGAMRLHGWRLALVVASMILLGGGILTVVVNSINDSAQQTQAAEHADREFLHLTVFSDALSPYLAEDLLTDGHQVCRMLRTHQGHEIAAVHDFQVRGFSLMASSALVDDGKAAYCPSLQTVPWVTEITR